MKKKMVGDVPGNVLGMLADLAHKLQHGSITPEELAMFLKSENLPEENILTLIQDWQKFLYEIFNVEADFSEVLIPSAPDELVWPICVPKGITTEQAFSRGKRQFSIRKYTKKSLDDVLDLSSGRDAWQNSYIVCVHPNVEADEDLKNLSANDIAAQKINTITLKERILLGRFLYWKKEIILDRKISTLCAGSCCSDGSVPAAGWFDGRFRVGWGYSGLRYGDLRARRAVS